ncbi:MAG TPA: hypothetical protein VN704_05755 [Verrucomicrobiae bacterium]|nr:hypothetical protein [Verrucomicrobiae bacterium]
MDYKEHGESDYNSKYGNRNDNEINNKDKIKIHVDKDNTRIYKKDDNDKLIANQENLLNPFTATLNLWQNYFKIWTDTYNKIMSNNSPFTNREFLFMYYRSDHKSNDQ